MLEHITAPPPHPPPLLTDEQILFLAKQGHLPLQLPLHTDSLYHRLANLSKEFFEQPDIAKNRDYPPSQAGLETGYTFLAGEKEYLTLRHRCRPKHDGMQTLIEDVWNKTAAVLHRVLADLAFAMNFSSEAWNPILDGSLSMPSSTKEATTTILRIFHYFPASGIVSEEHTDLGLLTLCVGSEPGLQVLLRHELDNSTRWVDVEGPTLLIGQVMRALSGNRVRAGVHRVVGNPNGRNSIVFALRPSLRHDQLDLASFGAKGILSMNQFWNDIKSSRFNVNAHKEVREEQKKALEEKKKAVNSIEDTA